MAYREVSMEEIREVIRLWLAGHGIKPMAARLGLDPKTVRRYVTAAKRCGLQRGNAGPDEELFAVVLAVLTPTRDVPRGSSWQRCGEQRDTIASWLKQDLKLSRIHSLLRRQGVGVPYSTLHRYAVAELGFGRRAPTIAVLEGEPGHELQVDTGWMTWLEPDADGRRRRFRAWIFTPTRSRYRFVYPCFRETTESAIEACEAAWEFYGGIFRVLIPDRTKAIVDTSDPLQPRLVAAFLEYAQARDIAVDPARARKPQDKARVERSVAYARDACFAGEVLRTLDEACARARMWCLAEAGERLHSRTQRRPREHFLAEELPALRAVPDTPYDIPLWAWPKVARDQYAQVAKALYSLPTPFVGKVLRARADRQTVRFYHGTVLVKTHLRVAPGARATDPSDFPEDRRIYAHGDLDALLRRATAQGPAIGDFTRRLLDVPLPWTRMRRVYALLGFVKKYGPERVEAACAIALAAEMTDIHRLQRMLEEPRHTPPLAPPAAPVVPIARFLRPASQYALFGKTPETSDDRRSDQP